MNVVTRLLMSAFAVMFAATQALSQSYSNDFENLNHLEYPWLNVKIVEDSTAHSGTHLCLCDTIQEYGLGFTIDAETDYPNQNINCQYNAWFRLADLGKESLIVVSIDNEEGNRYWQGYSLASFGETNGQWFPISLDLNFPKDYVKGSKIKIYLWNPNKNIIGIDDIDFRTKATSFGRFTPQITTDNAFENGTIRFINEQFSILYQPNDSSLVLADRYGKPISRPIGFVAEFLPSSSDFDLPDGYQTFKWSEAGNCQWANENKDFGCKNLLSISSGRHGQAEFEIESTFEQEHKSLRQSIVIPFVDSATCIYRKNQKIDTFQLQDEYYLDREGFIIGEGDRTVATYHNTGISSLQFDTESHTAYFNMDYWRDHPLLHYPLNNDTSDYFVNISYKELDRGCSTKNHFTLSVGREIQEMPRVMPIWDGYESAFIFTEHADWTDIRTHRAVLFGNENIIFPEDAVGGFTFFDIPVTKSVFFCNPDEISNNEISNGLFPDYHSTIKTDKDFYYLLKDLKDIGFDICLHTPEQYTSVDGNLKKALRFMRHQFGSPSWIDHGYNNRQKSNRENLVCDALNPDSPQFAKELWKRNGVKYLWNAYYEENRLEQFAFDGHFAQPYEGFGDALPNRQITTLPNDDYFRLWSTPSTLEINNDNQWYYFFHPKRLQRLVDNHNVFITHTYPAWSNPDRAFWQYNEDSTAVAMPGFNFALQQIATLREEKKMLPTTVQDYLSYYESLLNVDYTIIDDNTILLTNHGDAIKGFTILSGTPLYTTDKPIDFRKTDEGYYIWFDFNRKEQIKITMAPNGK